ncbi:hypothetical protein MMC12_007817 [Toensbergia leucococca]|nr:hypothetical protein [Toensbergia leucococca]
MGENRTKTPPDSLPADASPVHVRRHDDCASVPTNIHAPKPINHHDIETSPSANRRSLPPDTVELNLIPAEPSSTEFKLAHRTAVRRLNATNSTYRPAVQTTEAGSTTSTQPVLVRAYPNNSLLTDSPNQTAMRQPRSQTLDNSNHDLPPLESFSFQDILASIDPEVRLSIETIAEICGRSKMSLANEYESHLPPQGAFNVPGLEDFDANIVNSRLDPVEELSPSQEQPPTTIGFSLTEEDPQNSIQPRSKAAASRALLNVSSEARQTQLPRTSAPITKTSKETSSTDPTTSRPATSSIPSASFLPHFLTWLRHSNPDDYPLTHSAELSAAAALHKLLGGT